MSMRDAREQRNADGPRVGFFGLLGSGNLGNDGSFEAVLGAPPHGASRSRGRRHVHGRGTDEQSLRHPRHPAVLVHRPRRSDRRGRIESPLGTGQRHRRVAHVPVGAPTRSRGRRRRRGTRELTSHAGNGRAVRHVPALRVRQARRDQGGTARLSGPPKSNNVPLDGCETPPRDFAYYRSYRDRVSWDVMQQCGSFAKHDPVYTDLVFSLPAPKPAQRRPTARRGGHHGVLRRQ